MRWFEDIKKLKYLHWLITQNATGSPKQFAKKLGMTERSVYRIIDDLRLSGFPIRYSEHKKSYQYDKSVTVIIEISIEGERIL